MATTNINVRVDANLKKSAEALFADLGLNMSTAITMFLKSAVNHDGIPFEEKMENITSELSELFAKSRRLEEEVRKNLGGIGYDI